jgi:hypothetical protein
VKYQILESKDLKTWTLGATVGPNPVPFKYAVNVPAGTAAYLVEP